jgi:hypothetical protein
MDLRAIVVAAATSVALGCSINAVVTPIGSRLPAQPPDCPVSFFGSGPPHAPHQDVASIRVVCRDVVELRCKERLREEACAAGADAIYSIVTTTTGPGNYDLAATLAKISS